MTVRRKLLYLQHDLIVSQSCRTNHLPQKTISASFACDSATLDRTSATHLRSSMAGVETNNIESDDEQSSSLTVSSHVHRKRRSQHEKLIRQFRISTWYLNLTWAFEVSRSYSGWKCMLRMSNIVRGNSPVLRAIGSHNLAELQALIETKQATVNDSTESGETLLMVSQSWLLYNSCYQMFYYSLDEVCSNLA